MNQKEKKSSLTLGNVLLVLLVIGTFVVGGLMYKLYQELTKTPEITAQRHEQQNTQKIEVMSPDDKRSNAFVFKSASQAAMMMPSVASVPSAMDNQNVLTEGEVPITHKKPIQQKKLPGETVIPIEQNQGRVLEPINVPKNTTYDLQPTNELSKTESVPKRNNPPIENNAKPLNPIKPVQPKNNNSNEVIDSLL